MTTQDPTPKLRDEAWRTIWERKYAAEHQPLHVLDGFNALSAAQWQRMVHTFLDRIEIPNQADVLEVGCGAGAFIGHLRDCKSIAGIDYSANAITRVAKEIDGDFRVAEAARLPFADDSFDVILSFSVFFYFKDIQYTIRALTEMDRVARPGATIFVGDINDAEKSHVYERVRGNETRKTQQVATASVDHLFIPKDLFTDFAKNRGWSLEIIDEEQMDLPSYSCALYRYSVIMKRQAPLELG